MLRILFILLLATTSYAADTIIKDKSTVTIAWDASPVPDQKDRPGVPAIGSMFYKVYKRVGTTETPVSGEITGLTFVFNPVPYETAWVGIEAIWKNSNPPVAPMVSKSKAWSSDPISCYQGKTFRFEYTPTSKPTGTRISD